MKAHLSVKLTSTLNKPSTSFQNLCHLFKTQQTDPYSSYQTYTRTQKLNQDKVLTTQSNNTHFLSTQISDFLNSQEKENQKHETDKLTSQSLISLRNHFKEEKQLNPLQKRRSSNEQQYATQLIRQQTQNDDNQIKEFYQNLQIQKQILADQQRLHVQQKLLFKNQLNKVPYHRKCESLTQLNQTNKRNDELKSLTSKKSSLEIQNLNPTLKTAEATFSNKNFHLSIYFSKLQKQKDERSSNGSVQNKYPIINVHCVQFDEDIDTLIVKKIFKALQKMKQEEDYKNSQLHRDRLICHGFYTLLKNLKSKQVDRKMSSRKQQKYLCLRD